MFCDIKVMLVDIQSMLNDMAFEINHEITTECPDLEKVHGIWPWRNRAITSDQLRELNNALELANKMIADLSKQGPKAETPQHDSLLPGGA